MANIKKSFAPEITKEHIGKRIYIAYKKYAECLGEEIYIVAESLNEARKKANKYFDYAEEISEICLSVYPINIIE